MYTSIYIKEHNVFLLLLLSFVCSPVFGKQVKILYNVQQSLKKKKETKTDKERYTMLQGKRGEGHVNGKSAHFSFRSHQLSHPSKQTYARTHTHIHSHIYV